MTGDELAEVFEPPYWAVIFSNLRTTADADGYAQTADEMVALAATIPGYLGIESTRDPTTGFGITVSYWRDEAAIAAWRAHADHMTVQRLGRERWYRAYRLRVARVSRDKAWESQPE